MVMLRVISTLVALTLLTFILMMAVQEMAAKKHKMGHIVISNGCHCCCKKHGCKKNDYKHYDDDEHGDAVVIKKGKKDMKKTKKMSSISISDGCHEDKCPGKGSLDAWIQIKSGKKQKMKFGHIVIAEGPIKIDTRKKKCEDDHCDKK